MRTLWRKWNLLRLYHIWPSSFEMLHMRNHNAIVIERRHVKQWNVKRARKTKRKKETINGNENSKPWCICIIPLHVDENGVAKTKLEEFLSSLALATLPIMVFNCVFFFLISFTKYEMPVRSAKVIRQKRSTLKARKVYVNRFWLRSQTTFPKLKIF